MITSFYVSIFLLFYLFITVRVIQSRRVTKIVYGSGQDKDMARLVSAHSNFSSYVPIALLASALGESVLEIPSIYVHFYCLVLFLGRAFHFVGLTVKEKKGQFKFRIIGMHLTIWPLMVWSFLMAYHSICSMNRF